ncbi:uracil-DNA glycosylase [Rivibacter subsaxonicus]|uniref:Type-4 uracil-DNA glycosylase n=1 Tax=Rivibacter subsaxonicus TaxID=457575 RepID=A0A4Q7VV77_9BURK|nr:uracil-DNA glycosylase [Rivibacter subsaxonicus]RZU00567.1 DNA polymerase [Rivibacter subsaxonicus]
MAWDERQRRMLEAMGVRLWPQAEPEPEADVAAAAPVLPAQPAASPRAPAIAPATPRQLVTGPVATMDWPALRAAVAACTACSLCESRTQTVFGVGHQRAHWMIVGEAPGEQEDLRGEPFVGKAGQLLDNMLAAIGVSRQAAEGDDPARRVYIANVLKCRPPANRNPQPEEVARCAPFLQRQIELVQPRIILAMGRFAVESLLHTSDAIGKLRGRVHRVAGVPTIVSYHPAYLLRSPLEKARAWDDLCLALQTLGGAH